MAKKELSLKDFHKGSIDDIIEYMGTYNGKDFEERIKAFEAFNEPDRHIAERMIYHSDYVVNGHPTDSENMPGAYNLAHKELDNIAKDDYTKIEKEADLDKVVDIFVDEMLKHTVGGGKINKAIEKLKKKGWDDKKIREFKGRMFAMYFKNEHNEPLTPYQLSKNFKGKKKIQIKNELKSLANQTQQAYTGFLEKKMTDHLINEYDVLDISPYVEEKFKEKGLEHPDDHLMMHPKNVAGHYARLMGGDKDLKKLGYKRHKPAA